VENWSAKLTGTMNWSAKLTRMKQRVSGRVGFNCYASVCWEYKFHISVYIDDS
jgi:hypothetical protein